MESITLDRERTLRFTFNDLRNIHEKIGKKVGVDGNAWADLTVEDLQYILWVGLKYGDDALTLEQVGDIADMSQITEILKAVMRALGIKVPEDDRPTEAA